jgi:hypothetical protein
LRIGQRRRSLRPPRGSSHELGALPLDFPEFWIVDNCSSHRGLKSRAMDARRTNGHRNARVLTMVVRKDKGREHTAPHRLWAYLQLETQLTEAEYDHGLQCDQCRRAYLLCARCESLKAVLRALRENENGKSKIQFGINRKR